MRNNSICLALLVFMGYGVAAGCAASHQQSPSQEVKAFFVVGQEINFSGFRDLSPKCMDLSGYSRFMGIKYPSTQSVEILTAPPARPYQAFAVLESPPSHLPLGEETIHKLTDKAKNIGADAIILTCAPEAPSGSVTPASSQGKTVALAIKYRKF